MAAWVQAGFYFYACNFLFYRWLVGLFFPYSLRDTERKCRSKLTSFFTNLVHQTPQQMNRWLLQCAQDEVRIASGFFFLPKSLALWAWVQFASICSKMYQKSKHPITVPSKTRRFPHLIETPPFQWLHHLSPVWVWSYWHWLTQFHLQ